MLNFLRLTGLWAGVIVACWAGGLLGIALAFDQINVSPVWAPSGIALAAVYRFGARALPGVTLGVIAVYLHIGVPLPVMAGLAIGSTVEAAIGGLVLRRLVEGELFSAVRNSVVFIGIALAVTSVSAFTGVGLLVGFGVVPSPDFWSLWSTWWFGNVAGALVFAPLLLTWLRPMSLPPERRRPGLAVLVLSATVACSLLIFSNAFFAQVHYYPLAFLFLPLATWATQSFRNYGATLINLVIAAVSIYGTVHGLGPFVLDSISSSLLMLQGFIAICAMCTLPMAANLYERERNDRELLDAQLLLERRVEERTEALRQEVQERETTAEALRSLLAATALPNDQEFFRGCVRDLAAIYGVRYAFVGVFADDEQHSIRTLAGWNDGELSKEIIYKVAGTPCEDVLSREMEFIATDVQQRYPQDTVLTEMGVQSYFGAPLVTPAGETLGIAVIMDTKPLTLHNWSKPVLGIFAGRIALELERQQANSEIQLAASVFKDSDEAILIADRERRIVRANPAWYRITGYSFADSEGTVPLILRQESEQSTTADHLWTALNSEGTWQGELEQKRSDGTPMPTWQTVSTVTDEHGDIIRYIIIVRDISEKKATEEHIHYLAHFDDLTGLYNRAAFYERLDQSLATARRHNTLFALLFLDLDHFKLINDASGHAVGDELLQHIANRLTHIMRDEDTVARLGGDEFTLLLPNVDSDQDAVTVAEKILREIESPIMLAHNTEVVVTGSIGICVYPQDGNDADTLLQNADVAMYRAKGKGRNAFQFFTAEMHQQALKRHSMETELRRALNRADEHFVLHYQPQVESASGTMIACEALLRWRHPEQGMMSPADFIPVAEDSGLIVPLGTWVIREACAQQRRWRDMGLAPIRVTVNLSGRQLIRNQLVATVRQALSDYDMDPNHLELELTESAMMTHISENVEMMRQLRALGVHLSVDDFGTGYSSMSYLKRFPINRLKIDRSFVRDVVTDADDAAIVTATIAMAHTLNLSVVGEGVETVQQYHFLRSRGCEEMQGYYFSRPVPAADLVELMRSGARFELGPRESLPGASS